MNIVVIKTKNSGVFISDNHEAGSWVSSSINSHLFDGKRAEATFHKNWFKINAVPTKVEKIVPPKNNIISYKLKEGFVPSVKIPANVSVEFFAGKRDEDGDTIYLNEELRPFYDAVTEIIPESYLPIEFKLNVIAELETWQPTVTQFDVKYSLIDQILIHPALLPSRPCKLTLKESYDIIRKHIKTNIDNRVAFLSSDYDFCLTVSKHVTLCEPEAYQKNVASFRAKKPKYVTDYRKTRTIDIYRVAPPHNGGVWQDYPLVTAFTGENYEDLLKNIKDYLDDLMRVINEPVKDCDKCKGAGVLTEILTNK